MNFGTGLNVTLFPALSTLAITELRGELNALLSSIESRDIGGFSDQCNQTRSALWKLPGGCKNFELIRFKGTRGTKSEGLLFSRSESGDSDGAVIWDLILKKETRELRDFRIFNFLTPLDTLLYYPAIVTLHGLGEAGLPYRRHYFEYSALMCLEDDYVRGHYLRVPNSDQANDLMLALSQIAMIQK